MNCETIKKRFLLDYMEERLGPSQKTLVDDHLANCPRCRQEFEQVHDIGRFLRSYTVPDPGEAFWDRLSSKIYSRVSSKKLTRKKPWEIVQNWMTWKRLVYAATPILLILLFFPAYHLYQSHFRELTYQENVLTVEEIGNGFFLIEESLTGLPANQLKELVQNMTALIIKGEILAEPECLDGLGWGIDEEIFQMTKEELYLLVKTLQA